MKKIRLIPVTVLLFIFLFWLVSILKCELRTLKYKDEFSELYKLNPMINKIDSFKVMSYSESNSKVYYIAEEHSSGNLYSFIKENGQWHFLEWQTIWSESGSASEFIWPYFYDSSEGLAIGTIIGGGLVLLSVMSFIGVGKTK